MLLKTSLIVQSLFYLIAGINHFINPDFYITLIPDYLPEKEAINVVAGTIEILVARGLLSEKFRKPAVVTIIIMLLAFIPSHVHFIQIGSCIDLGLCVSPIISWLRLIIIHPLLIWWANTVYHKSNHQIWGK